MTLELHEHSSTELWSALGIAMDRERTTTEVQTNVIYELLTKELKCSSRKESDCPGNVDSITRGGVEISLVGMAPGRLRVDVVFALEEDEEVDTSNSSFSLGHCGGVVLVSGPQLWWDFGCLLESLDATRSLLEEGCRLAKCITIKES